MQENPKEIQRYLEEWEMQLQCAALPVWEELPSIEVYMDQLLILLTQYLSFLPKDGKSGKVVTASAINNYVRLKLMPAPNKKKYGRRHLAYLIMICTLKQSVSIAYIEKMLPNNLTEQETQKAYEAYIACHARASHYFIEQVQRMGQEILHKKQEGDALGHFITATAAISVFSKLLTERMIDVTITQFNKCEKEEKKEKTKKKEPH